VRDRGSHPIHCPLAGIANGKGTRIPHSGETFVGGLSNGANGIFAFNYRNGFTDPCGNACFTRDPVHLRIGRQKSRDADDGRDTVGNRATAWIELSVDPRDAGYEYAVLGQPDEAAFAEFGRSGGYEILQKDPQAHVVRDRATRSPTWPYGGC
jgi:hypothetical protein